jgi:hypothetical protein
MRVFEGIWFKGHLGLLNIPRRIAEIINGSTGSTQSDRWRVLPDVKNAKITCQGSDKICNPKAGKGVWAYILSMDFSRRICRRAKVVTCHNSIKDMQLTTMEFCKN